MNPFLRETLDRVEVLQGQAHISFEVKQAFKDLIAVIEQMEILKNENTGMSADQRYKSAKLAEERTEKRRVEKSLESMRQAISEALPPVIRDLKTEIQTVQAQGQNLKNDSLVASAERMKTSLRQFIEIMTAAGKVY